VLDWLVLANRGERTRVVPDSQRPTWGAPLPDGVQAVELADLQLSQFSPDAVSFRGDSVLVFAPISPGRKELVLQYRIPGSERRLVAPAAGADSVFVLLEEPDARVERPRLARGADQQMQGRSFTRWAGVLGDDSQIEIRLPARGDPAADPARGDPGRVSPARMAADAPASGTGPDRRPGRAGRRDRPAGPRVQ
jgi:hypothetical protein